MSEARRAKGNAAERPRRLDPATLRWVASELHAEARRDMETADDFSSKADNADPSDQSDYDDLAHFWRDRSRDLARRAARFRSLATRSERRS